jgi:hypothetical protein
MPSGEKYAGNFYLERSILGEITVETSNLEIDWVGS